MHAVFVYLEGAVGCWCRSGPPLKQEQRSLMSSDRLKELSARIRDGSHADDNTPSYLVRPPSFSDNEVFTNAPSQGKSQTTHNNMTNDYYQGISDPSVNGFNVVRGRYETAITEMKGNFNRNNQLDSMLDKSGNLQQGSERFNNQPKESESQNWWKRWLVPAVTFGVVILLMTILCFLNKFVFWFLVVCMVIALISVLYFYANKRHRQLTTSMPAEVAMSII